MLSFQIVDHTIRDLLRSRLDDLEEHFGADVLFFHGEFHPATVKVIRDFLEELKADDAPETPHLVMFLNSPGGSVEAVEKIVEVIRHHYEEVSFVVPDYAMSAGTILCMSGDRIYMDYSSALGPIDPQVWNGESWVPALGYLDKVEELIEKARDEELTGPEFVLLQSQDLAQLSRYEQARNLTVTLLERWLVEYKFRTWATHESDPKKIGNSVTDAEKKKRAAEIAQMLGDNKLWHSHGRNIGVSTLWEVLRLKINDYSDDADLRALIRAYSDLIIEYIRRENFSVFIHCRAG